MTVWVAIAALAMALSNAAPAMARAQGWRRPNVSHPQGRQNGHSGQWLRQYRGKSPEQQRRALENDPQFRKLPPQRQQQLRQRLEDFNRRPPEQQQRMINRMETWEHLTPQQKDQARQLHSQMSQLPPERRQAVQNGIQALRAMPPDAREREIDSDAYKKQFSPQEREMLKGASRLPLAPAEPPKAPDAGVPKPPGQ
jgi:hypothetical protein